jgi:CubicO group peptidase (beta-lactamase class C family)
LKISVLLRFVMRVQFLLLFLLLAACGGGNGSGGPPPTTQTPPTQNQAPTANAGADQRVDEGTKVELAGSGADGDGTVASYSWQQDSGTVVTISDDDMASASFTAPTVTADEDLVFSLIVTDNNGATASDTVKVTVVNFNAPPVANAGADQDAITGLSVALDGTASSDADGDPLTYSWTLISMPSGSSVTLDDASTMSPTFTPDFDGSYVFELVVNDGMTNSAPASVTIYTTTPPYGAVGDGKLDRIVEDVRAQENLPALAVIVVRKNTIAEWTAVGQRAMGFPNVVSTSDQWHIGSLTKAMTGTLIAMYVEQSLLDWDTRPLDVWPELAQSIHPEYVNVTMAQLLTHRAGLAIQAYDVPSESALQDNAPGTVTEKRRLWAEELLALPPETPIGSYQYTNSGYIIAGAMLETLTGDTWENMIQMNLFGPLGMIDSGFGAPGTRGQLEQPRGHRVISGALRPVEPGPGSDNVVALGPAGTVHTTMADYSNFMIMHINGARGIGGLVTAQSFEYLHSPPFGSYYAIGWIFQNEPNGGGRVLLHLGSNNLWVAKVRLMPDIEAGIFLVVNASNTDAQQAIATLEGQITERILATP